MADEITKPQSIIRRPSNGRSASIEAVSNGWIFYREGRFGSRGGEFFDDWLSLLQELTLTMTEG